MNTNKTALNGVQNLANKKQETTANINQLSHLNNAQKQDLNTQVTNAPNISTVNQVKTKAEQLDRSNGTFNQRNPRQRSSETKC